MGDIHIGFPDSVNQSSPPVPPQEAHAVGGIEQTHQRPSFKDPSFLNGLFLTIIIALVLSEVVFLAAEILKIYVANIYRSEINKISIIDPFHWQVKNNFTAVDAISRQATIGLWLIFLTSSTCMLFWMFRNYKNSTLLAGLTLRLSAKAATAGLAIPFVNCYWPYFAVSEMVRIAKDKDSWSSMKAPIYVHLWWIFNIASIFLAVCELGIELYADQPLYFYTATYLRTAATACAILKNLLLIPIIVVIWEGARYGSDREMSLDHP